jgi:16S rRNA (adenine1518-N6/adenine1519-N6)-dimethyltransferase
MDPRKISELHQLFSALGIQPKKSLSQNFFIEKNTLEKLVSFANIQEGESVLEIGPGLGAITLTLLEKGAKVIAVELDRKLALFLKESISTPNFTLIEGDFLTTPLTSLPSPMKLIANIPFQITSPILNYLSQHRTLFSLIHLVVQKDLAVRMIAQKGSGQNGPFSIFCQYYFTVKILSTISPNNFYPKPSIESAYIELIPKQSIPFENGDPFFDFVHSLFHKKRKMIRSSISHPDLDLILSKRGLNSTMRPGELSLDDFIYIFKHLKKA